jgi:hypothetical protein
MIYNNSMNEPESKIRELLSAYSINDLLKSFFVLNLWLPNLASPIRIQYLYVVLECVHQDLPKDDRMHSYEDFEYFCKELIETLPSFPMLEDYVPEADWGEIKYFYQNELYKIFYGADLSNPYDFYYSFEIIHKTFEGYYVKHLDRSPFNEFEFCLNLQNHILNGIEQEEINKPDIEMGDIKVPSAKFWEDCNTFLDVLDVENISRLKIIDFYARDLNKKTPKPDLSKFIDSAFMGLNCPYFLIRHCGKYFPVMPRKFFSVLYDSWGRILKEHYEAILKSMKKPETSMGIELHKFLRERIDEKRIFELASPVNGKQEASKVLFTTALHINDKLVLINVLPLPIGRDLDNYLKDLNDQLKEAAMYLSGYPTRLRLWARKGDVEFRSAKSGEQLTPIFITVIPYFLTAETLRIKIPKNFPGEIMDSIKLLVFLMK